MKTISITGYSSISALGSDVDEVWGAYAIENHFLEQITYDNVSGLVSRLPTHLDQAIHSLKHSHQKYQVLDKTVLMAIYAARKALKNARWDKNATFGVNIGSSRGATQLFEQFYDDFSTNHKSRVSPLTSPTTTLGNLSTWVADDLQSSGPVITHSITCSTGLHAVLNAVAWINSGMSEKFMVGATEAPNTAFTIAQMQSLKIYSDHQLEYPCRALDLEKSKNSMCLGEGAAIFCLEQGVKSNALALIDSIGYGTEKLTHNVSVTQDAKCFQDSMHMALSYIDEDVDVIVMHAPGTIKGDSSEMRAIEKVFGSNIPAVTSNKWKIGHTLGASGSLSMELAILMLEKQEFIGIPYLKNLKAPEKIERIMVNAVGFGGNAVSVVLKRNTI
ncbi:MAG: beta-ketoacyl synthase N-terminal-like domain-containing protein [Wenyingzhuangia sp.]|uniref:beta-ketoacyl synthase N-terminal-like domain-containing protein n=1 Tax=Wenyingzhuangia sp. TaxID=1964193 RepID=UPI00321AFF66